MLQSPVRLHGFGPALQRLLYADAVLLVRLARVVEKVLLGGIEAPKHFVVYHDPVERAARGIESRQQIVMQEHLALAAALFHTEPGAPRRDLPLEYAEAGKGARASVSKAGVSKQSGGMPRSEVGLGRCVTLHQGLSTENIDTPQPAVR